MTLALQCWLDSPCRHTDRGGAAGRSMPVSAWHDSNLGCLLRAAGQLASLLAEGTRVRREAGVTQSALQLSVGTLGPCMHARHAEASVPFQLPGVWALLV